MPPVVAGYTGAAREFGEASAMACTEFVASSSLLTRSVTVRCLIDYGIEDHADAATGYLFRKENATGTECEVILTRNSATELNVKLDWDIVSGSTGIAGIDFIKPVGSFYLTAVRQWESSTSVTCYYYVNGLLIGSEAVTKGDIVTGAFSSLHIGYGGSAGTYLPDETVIDAIAVENDPMTAGEIKQDFDRLETHETNGRIIMSDYMPQGSAISKDPDSNIQKLLSALGDVLGYVISKAERYRIDGLPDTTYGPQLSAWERVFNITPGSLDTVLARQTRLLSRFQQYRGYSLSEIKLALEPSFGLDSSDIEIVEYTATRTDDFSTDDITATPSPLWITRQDGSSVVTVATGVCVCQSDNSKEGTWFMGGEPACRETSLSARKGSQVTGARIEIDISVDSDEVESGDIAGVFMRNTSGDFLIYGISDNGGGSNYMYYTDGVAAPTLIESSERARIAMRYIGSSQYELGYDNTGVFTVTATISGPDDPKWGGFGSFYLGAAASTVEATFDNAEIFEPLSTRALNWLAYRDPALDGVYDIRDAQTQIRKQGPAHTNGLAAISKYFKLGTIGRLGIDPLYPKE